MTVAAPRAAARERLTPLLIGYRALLAIHTIVQLGIPERLAAGPRHVESLATEAGAHAPSLGRLCRFLASLGVLEEVDERTFALTDVGELLRGEVPGSARDGVRVIVELELPAWLHVLEAVRTGRTAFEHAHGAGYFEHLSRPEQAEMSALFDGYMSGITLTQARALLDAYDLSPFERFVDIGGGNGTLVAEILRAQPRLRAVLFDLPAVVERARERLATAGVLDRCEIVGGDFFQAVPSGAGLYHLKWIIHDWDDERALLILRNCRRAMGERASLVLFERVVPPGLAAPTDEFFAALSGDAHMLALTGGRERTEAEFAQLLDAAGFRLARVIPTASLLSVVEAVSA